MAVKRRKQRSSEAAAEASVEPLSLHIDDAIVEARAAVDDGLLEYLNNRSQLFGEAGISAADFADGLLISILRLIAPDGAYAMEKGRFWQILDRHNPFSPLTPEAAMQARLAAELEGLLTVAENESFEDGFDSALSLELHRLVLKHGDAAVELLADAISGSRIAPVAAEALRALGAMNHPESHEARRQILERGLESPSHVVRDGALVGLSSLCDPHTIPAIEAAAARESYRLLRANMSDLLERLKGLSP